jgi:hypothetical protein
MDATKVLPPSRGSKHVVEPITGFLNVRAFLGSVYSTAPTSERASTFDLLLRPRKYSMAEALRRFRGWWIADDVPYSVHAGFIAVLSLLSFWPFLAGYSNVQRLEQSPMVVGLVSIDNMLASAAAIALITPLAIDALVEYTTRVASKCRNHQQNLDDGSTYILNFVERLVVYAGLILSPVCVFVRSSNLGLLALCCSRFQFAAVYGGWVLCASRLMPTWFPAKFVMLTMACNTVSLNLKAYTNISGLDSIDKYGLLLRLAALIILVVMATNWLLNRLLLPYCRQRGLTLSSLPTEAVVDEESTLDQRFARHKWTKAMKQTVLSRKTAFVAVLVAVAGTTVGLTMSILDVKAYSELVAKDLVQVSSCLCSS